MELITASRPRIRATRTGRKPWRPTTPEDHDELEALGRWLNDQRKVLDDMFIKADGTGDVELLRVNQQGASMP